MTDTQQHTATPATSSAAASSSGRAFDAVPAQLDLPAVDHQIIDLWKRQDTFAESLRRTADGPRWTFYEGPPTANGRPGAHHIEARVFKDVFPRFKTMQGFHVDRMAGWDCHGLPVELAIEAELGLNGKPDIERYGIGEFNERCRESVRRHVDAFTELTERMGYWVDLDQAYWTMHPDYVQSVWWAIKQIFDAGLLVESYRVAPYCPRCGTPLSDHELGQEGGYETIVDPSVYVRLPLTSGPWAGKADLLIWTTTPWTLPSNALVAASADVTYVIAAKDGEQPVVVAENLVEHALGEGWSATGDRVTGAEMVGWTYERPFDIVAWPGTAHFVVTEDYVTTDDGTGLVHEATVFGADDMESVLRNGVELVNPIDLTGHFAPDLDLVGGVYFRDANRGLIDDLAARGVLFRELDYEHSYPHCWRCHSALMYYALPSWYIRTTAIKDALLRENAGTNWYPDTIKWGRYGDWLNNNVDWALSRSRYWGTPLPVWRNDETGDLVCVGSLAELSELTGQDLAELDPHRPFIDEITFAREGVAGTYRRVPDVLDAWFDSGSMPFAQFGYPYVEGSAERFAPAYPADFICEAIDQTRGWFYSLMAVGTLVFDKSSYRNVVCLGHILAEDGRKMSKHLGNIMLPIPLMEQHGADPVRWFMAAGGTPWSGRRLGDATLAETVRKVFLTYWNTVSFHALYARSNNWLPGESGPLGVLDRWLVSVRNRLVAEVTAALDVFDTQRAGALLAAFIDDLSNWYVRRSRRRFWAGDPAALTTLHETLDVLTRLMAPLAPFVTERVWQDLFAATDPDAPASVHLTSWPTTDEGAVDPALDAAMDVARRVVELGRTARSESKIRTRQPLRRVLIPGRAHDQLGPELLAEVAAELNVGEVASLSAAGRLVTYTAKANFRSLGKRYGKRTPEVAGAIAAADAEELSRQLAAEGSAVVGGDLVLPEDVIITEQAKHGWSVANGHGETVAVDLELTPELIAAGLAREVVRAVQQGRKDSGLDVTDRVSLTWQADDDLADAITGHANEIADEVLATSMTRADVPADALTDADLGLRFTVTRVG